MRFLSSNVLARQVLHVGRPVTIHCTSPSAPYAVMFEDDGETGCFYGLDTRRRDNQICDALSIYRVPNVTDRAEPSTVQIVWSADGLKSALVINGYPHAVFDFAARRGYCRDNFPPPDTRWTRHSHEWQDSALRFFR